MDTAPSPVPSYVASFVRWLITVGTAYVLGKGWLSADQAAQVGAAIVAILPLVWSLFQKREAAVKYQKAIDAPEGQAE